MSCKPNQPQENTKESICSSSVMKSRISPWNTRPGINLWDLGRRYTGFSFKKSENTAKAGLRFTAAIWLLLISMGGCSPAFAEPVTGIASWYDSKSTCKYNPHPNCPMANGESILGYERRGRSYSANWDFPFGTQLLVTNLKNGKSVTTVVTDRGPNKRLHRLVDLSKKDFQKIADQSKGLIPVKVEVLS